MVNLLHGDCLDVLKTLDDCSIDSIVTDPPYGLSDHRPADVMACLSAWLAGEPYLTKKRGFMGKTWDSWVPGPEVWRECFRVLKPGGHILAFAGSRTHDLMSIALRLAGFECRDTIMYVYGCLDEQTELVTKDGVKPYHKAIVGEHILCYDTETGQYDYQPIQEIVEYDYSDTAYRLIGDFGEQVVSRNHRVIVERSGKEVFQFAETLPVEVCVPFLEDLPELQKAISGTRPISGHSQKGLQQGVCGRNDFKGDGWQEETPGESQGQNAVVLGMRQGVLEAGLPDQEIKNACMQLQMQRHIARGGMEEARTQGQKKLESCIRSGAKRENDGEHQSCVEWRCNISASKGELFESADKVCTVPDRVPGYGASGRLCNGASIECCESDRACFDKGGVCSSHQSRCDGQPTGESNAIRDKRGSQSVRGWQGHKTAMVRVVPFHYTGKVWCVRVPTGAFVAVRNGLAFPTGNSGFPKSHDISKAIDKAAGAEREVVGKNPTFRKMQDEASAYNLQRNEFITAPATEAARQWQGWGTALKPAYEPVLLFRKPLAGTVAENVLKHGTGGINIDGCRIGTESTKRPTGSNPMPTSAGWNQHSMVNVMGGSDSGRWPANFIHDGSDEVLALFPVTKSSNSKPRNNGEFKSVAKGRDAPNTTFGHDDNGGSAARFFFRAGHEKEDLLFCRAKAILSAWKLTKGVQPCSQENASVAESSLCLSRQAVVSVLSDAVIAASRGDRLLSDARGLSTTATESECERLCETLITAMLISESVALPAPSQDVLIQNGCHVNVAAIQKPTDTMTITISLPKSGGYAEHVTFSIMPSSMAHGAKGLNDRFRYCAKASRRDRDEGLDGFAAKARPTMGSGIGGQPNQQKENNRNTHNTVKPTNLMRYLCRLVTPPNGVILDPFMGSGSTGKAAVLEGFSFVGIEREAEYLEIAKARIAHVSP